MTNPRPGLTAHKARARVKALRTTQRHRQMARRAPPAGRMHVLGAAQKRAQRLARAALVRRRLELGAAIDRLERTGAVTEWSSDAQQRRGTIPAGPRARRLRALQGAYARRVRVNPRKARTMAKKMKRNRLGRFVKRARGHLGRLVAGTPRRKRRKSRASRSRRRLQPTQGATMSRALVANPRRKRRRARRASSRRRTSAGRFTKRNPRRRVRRHHGRHRRNPGMAGGFVKSAIGSLLPMGIGGIGGAVCGFADAKFMSDKPVVSALSKVALGALGAALLRKRPALAYGWAGGVIGSFGYSMGVKASGGLVAHSPTTALKGIADMASENPEMAALLEGLGDSGNNDDGIGDASSDYVSALGDAAEDYGVGDLVDAE